MLIFSLVFAGIESELSDSELRKVLQGQEVVREESVRGPWPKVTVFRYVNLDALSSAAVFSDFKTQKNYISDLKEVIVRNPNSKVKEVEYLLDMPWPVIDERYVLNESLEILGDNDFKISWEKVRSVHSEEILGSMRIHTYGNGSLLRYENFVRPESERFAGLFRSRALKQVVQTAKQLATEMVRRSSEDPNRLRLNQLDFQAWIDLVTEE